MAEARFWAITEFAAKWASEHQMAGTLDTTPVLAEPLGAT
jgi:hypothetical protein